MSKKQKTYTLTVKFDNYDRYTKALQLLNSPVFDVLFQAVKDHEAALAQARQEGVEAERKRCREEEVESLKKALESAKMSLHQAPWGDGADHPDYDCEAAEGVCEQALAAVEKIQKEKP